jgi:hypothetical protein
VVAAALLSSSGAQAQTAPGGASKIESYPYEQALIGVYFQCLVVQGAEESTTEADVTRAVKAGAKRCGTILRAYREAVEGANRKRLSAAATADVRTEMLAEQVMGEAIESLTKIKKGLSPIPR